MVSGPYLLEHWALVSVGVRMRSKVLTMLRCVLLQSDEGFCDLILLCNMFHVTRLRKLRFRIQISLSRPILTSALHFKLLPS